MRPAAQAAGKVIFENPAISVGNMQGTRALAINQKVNLAIGTAKEIERDSRPKKREKGASTGRSPSG
jgi:hypothetical protein